MATNEDIAKLVRERARGPTNLLTVTNQFSSVQHAAHAIKDKIIRLYQFLGIHNGGLNTNKIPLRLCFTWKGLLEYNTTAMQEWKECMLKQPSMNGYNPIYIACEILETNDKEVIYKYKVNTFADPMDPESEYRDFEGYIYCTYELEFMKIVVVFSGHLKGGGTRSRCGVLLDTSVFSCP